MNASRVHAKFFASILAVILVCTFGLMPASFMTSRITPAHAEQATQSAAEAYKAEAYAEDGERIIKDHGTATSSGVPVTTEVTIQVKTGSSVPDVTYITLTEAIEAIEDAGLTWEANGSLDPKAIVIWQSPNPGTLVEPGAQVSLNTKHPVTPSHGRVPDLFGMTYAAAQQALAEAGFEWKLLEDGDSPDALIIKQFPAAGEEYPLGAAISLTAKDPNPDPARLTVPDVTGRTLEEATTILEDAALDFTWAIKGSKDSHAVVVSQSPKPGETAVFKMEITLTTEEPDAWPTVPDVTGDGKYTFYKLQDAIDILAATGFRAAVIGPKSADAIVMMQNPLPNTQAAFGSLVTLTTRPPAEDVQVPDVVGMTLKEAIDALKAVGLEWELEAGSDNLTSLVTRQNPLAGTMIPQHTQVGLTTKQEDPKPDGLKVPNVVGLTLEQATQALRSLGLTHKVTGSEDPKSVVTHQTPAAGTTALAGDTITLTTQKPDIDNPQPTPKKPVSIKTSDKLGLYALFLLTTAAIACFCLAYISRCQTECEKK